MEGLQVLLVWTCNWGGGEITCHAIILIPVVKVIALLLKLYSQFFSCDILWFIYIILWRNFNRSNICHIPLLRLLISYYQCVSSQKLNDLLSAISIIGVYIHYPHHIIVSLVFVSYIISYLKGWSWIFSLCWFSPNFVLCIQ